MTSHAAADPVSDSRASTGLGHGEVSERRIDQVRTQLSAGDVAAAPAGEDDQRS